MEYKANNENKNAVKFAPIQAARNIASLDSKTKKRVNI